MTWHAPIPNWHPDKVPQAPHPGAFQVERKFHIHEGVDLYTEWEAPVFAVEEGVIVDIRPFTGAALGHAWWHNTDAIFVHGESGIVVYGEMTPIGVQKGDRVRPGQMLGCVARVLKKDKGRPMDMLHMELRDPTFMDAFSVFDWKLDMSKPVWLLDPTPYLLSISNK